MIRLLTMGLAVAAATSAVAQPTPIRVGAGGDHATIQAGLDAALATPEPDEIRVRAGTYAETVTVGWFDLGGGVEISGGWDAAFATRDPDPTSTVIDGGAAGRVFDAGVIEGSALILRGLTLRDGSSDVSGAGMYVSALDADVRIERCRFEANLLESSNGTAGAPGGGLLASVNGTSRLTIVDSAFVANEARLDAAIGVPQGGNAMIFAGGSAVVHVHRSTFQGGRITGGSQRRGAGLSLQTDGGASARVEDSTFTGNHGVSGEISGAGLSLSALSASSIDARRLALTENRWGAADASSQLYLRPWGTSTVRLSDSLLARGGTGVVASTAEGVVRLVNVTATDHADFGLSLFVMAPAVGSVANTIAWANADGDAVLSGGAITQQANRIGSNPQFVDPAGGNYRLAPGSPAIGAGLANPLGGLGRLDRDHAPRTYGALPDQGAYERNALFGDGFESADLGWWSPVIVD